MHGLNVETKAYAGDLDALAERSARAGARFAGTLEQVDTYFAVDRGRLKLREIVESSPHGGRLRTGELIRYERPDGTGARASRYERRPVDDPVACGAALEREHGVRTVVRKQRDLWLLASTRIHLDRVEGLGTFVELETVVEEQPLEAARAEHERVLEALGIQERDTIAVSYADLQAGGGSA